MGQNIHQADGGSSPRQAAARAAAPARSRLTQDHPVRSAWRTLDRRAVARRDDLIARVLAHDPGADVERLRRACGYAARMHGDQRRESGDPYYAHPVEVAHILAGLRLDLDTIITALLHDTLEDTPATYDDIERRFGPKVADLVDGVTRLARLKLTSEESRQAEDFRKLLIATSQDVRVLLVKLADRLHNMRTLHFVESQAKRRRVAQETMDIYAPLAGRMGMQEFRDELEDTAFAELNAEARTAIVERLARVRASSADAVEEVTRQLRENLALGGVSAQTTSREKRPYAIWRKMEQRSISFEQLSDVIGFRVVAQDAAACYRALAVAHTTWQSVPGRFKDYISTPKTNGYQSIHSTVIGPGNQRVELQFRTGRMHEVADYGIAAHWIYKEKQAGGATPQDLGADVFGWLRRLIEMLEHEGTPEEFLEHTKLELFQDQVFCFTPKGRLIALPGGATPIDFAYAVHTDVGDTCVGCRINGQHAPLRTRLRSGEEVEIIRSRAQAPLPAWETMVVTGKARSAIRRAVRQTRTEECVRLGRDILGAMFAQAGRKATDKVLERVLVPLRQESLTDLLAAVGRADVQASQVLQIAYPRAGGGHIRRLVRPGARRRSVRIRNVRPGTAVRFAEDCFPVPGDRIVGVMTPGEGVTIYPINSSKLRAFDDVPERWLEVTWEVPSGEQTLFTGRVCVTCVNEVGVLGVISTLIADYGANIANLALTSRQMDFYDMQMDMEVRDLKHFNQVLSALRGLSVISSVVRVHG